MLASTHSSALSLRWMSQVSVDDIQAKNDASRDGHDQVERLVVRDKDTNKPDTDEDHEAAKEPSAKLLKSHLD